MLKYDALDFSELGLVEEWGSGYKRIQAACQNGGYPEPKWEEMGTVLRITFFPHPDIAKTVETRTKSGLSWNQVGTKSELNTGLPTELTLDEKKLLHLCRQLRTTTELMQAMGWKNRTKFRDKFLTPLIEKGLLTMTIPEKPNSRNQKYQATELALDLLSL